MGLNGLPFISQKVKVLKVIKKTYHRFGFKYWKILVDNGETQYTVVDCIGHNKKLADAVKKTVQELFDSGKIKIEDL